MPTGTDIFTTPAGMISAVDGNSVPFAFAIDGSVDTFHDLKAIITSVGIQQQSGFQFMHALREFIYVYVFTERIGELVINGLAFPDVCASLNEGIPPTYNCTIDGDTGFGRILQWYECNRITSRAAPITLVIGTALGIPDVSYTVFLVGMKADIVNAETGIVQFTMRFNLLPNISDNDDRCFPMFSNCLDQPCNAQFLPSTLPFVDDLERLDD